MHKETIAAIGCVAVLLLSSGCAQQTRTDARTSDESAIRELDAQWSKTAAANDLEGTVSYYSDDATLLPPNAPVVTGKPAIRALWASMLVPGGSISWEAKKVDVANSGELAYLTGVYAVTAKDAQGRTLTDHGKEVEVWKKQADGNWKVAADIWNSDLPANQK